MVPFVLLTRRFSPLLPHGQLVVGWLCKMWDEARRINKLRGDGIGNSDGGGVSGLHRQGCPSSELSALSTATRKKTKEGAPMCRGWMMTLHGRFADNQRDGILPLVHVAESRRRRAIMTGCGVRSRVSRLCFGRLGPAVAKR